MNELVKVSRERNASYETAENPDCHAEVTCFKFTLTKNQNNKYNIECGDHCCHVTSDEFGASFPNATRELLEQFCDPTT